MTHPPAHRGGKCADVMLCALDEWRELERLRHAKADLLARCDVADREYFNSGGTLSTAEIRRCLA